MGKLFFTLYVLLALAITGFIVGQATLTEPILKDSLDRYFAELSKGTVTLLDASLDQNQERWPAQLRTLQKEFGYPIDMRPIDRLALPAERLQRLRNGETLYEKIDAADYLYRRVKDSDQAWEVVLSETKSEHFQRITVGTFYLLEQALLQQPESAWPGILAQLNTQFTFLIALQPMESMSLTPVQRDRLLRGLVLSTDAETDDERHHRRLGTTDNVLTIGPFVEPVFLAQLKYILLSILAIMIALVVFFWIRPLWRGLAQLRTTADAFGRGDFAARTRIAPRAALGQFAHTFNAMADRIQQLITSHKELTNAVSHELRTPLARLRFGMEMLQNAPDKNTRVRHLAGMNGDIDELEGLIAELLTYARFDHATPELKLERQYLSAWLNETVNRTGSGDRHITVHVQPVADDVCTDFEPRLMARALGNILQNAQRYATQRIEVRIEASADRCCIIIDDDGPGIPAVDRARIFEPFTRLDTSRNRDSGGYGLGLAIAQRIAHLHGGNIGVEDSPLGGTRFIISWPAHSAYLDAAVAVAAASRNEVST